MLGCHLPTWTGRHGCPTRPPFPRDAARTARLLDGALRLWRGPVFGGLCGGTLSQLAGARYEEYRIRAMELRFDAVLRLGQHAAILADLAEAHASHPLRERFCEQLSSVAWRGGESTGGAQRLSLRAGLVRPTSCISGRCHSAADDHVSTNHPR
ncbi:AfsR/SARP family transcriptional regulator [Streptomyces sp. NPDC016566]|uniref:AfsR/SARP family transcriptional regulator n=1 Tax=Streptomyces sp. NPDC016566 TaxID=3364967 RepID=UPI0036F7D809